MVLSKRERKTYKPGEWRNYAKNIAKDFAIVRNVAGDQMTVGKEMVRKMQQSGWFRVN